jgi:nicotinate phosphoribosyltransferase
MRERIYNGGKLVYESPTLEEIRERCKVQVAALWDETKRFENPEPYIVDLSKDLWELKQKLLKEHSNR